MQQSGPATTERCILAIAGGLWIIAAALHALSYYSAWMLAPVESRGFLAANLAADLVSILTVAGLVYLGMGTLEAYYTAISLITGYLIYFALLQMRGPGSQDDWGILRLSHVCLVVASAIGAACSLALMVAMRQATSGQWKIQATSWTRLVAILGLITAGAEVGQVIDYLGVGGLLASGAGTLTAWVLSWSILGGMCVLLWRYPTGAMLGVFVGYLWAWMTNIHALVGLYGWIQGSFDPAATSGARMIGLATLVVAAAASARATRAARVE